MPHQFQILFNHRTAARSADKTCENCAKAQIVGTAVKESYGKICQWKQIKCIKFPCYYDNKTKTRGTYNTLSFKVCDAWAKKDN